VCCCIADIGIQNALAILSISAYHTCAPINASCTAGELLEDGRRLGIKAIVTTADAEQRLELHHLRQKLGCEIIYLTPKQYGPAGLFELSLISQVGAAPRFPAPPARLHGLNDYSLILHTSGTSGKKKVVPYTLRSLIIGTLAVMKSWGLRSNDVNSKFL
jgi:acyl-coenzyme A synthetase/AMP-(fatty) acid ligase